MKTRDKKYLTQLVTASALGSLLASPVYAARLDGRVSDSSGTRFLGAAIVKLPSLNRQTTTGRDGRYSFSDIPPGEYNVVVDYVGAERVSETVTVSSTGLSQDFRVGAEVPPMENVLVYGQFAQQANAINQQRANDRISSIITADDAGALPDNNIAEALQRAPGVYIERDQGEGRFVGIRGLNPSLNTVKINGINVAAPDAGERATALDVVPSELLENLEISKSYTPDMDGDAIGGTIDVKSLSGFDRDGQYFSVGAESSYNDLLDEWSPKVNGSYSNVFDAGSQADALAIALSLSYEDRDFGSFNLEHDDGWAEAENGNLFPEEPELRDYAITRERIGAAFNIDWRPNSRAQYYLRTLYSDFEDDEIRNRIEIAPEEDSGVIAERAASFDEAEYTRSLKDRIETQEIISVVIGGLNQFDNWDVDYALGYSYAEEDEPNRHDTDFAATDDFTLAYTGLGEIPGYQLDTRNLAPQFYELDEIVVENNFVEDEEVSFSLNIARRMDLGSNSGELKFGGKVRQRDKDRDSDIDVFDDFGDDAISAELFATGNVSYDLLPFGFGLSPGAIRSFTGGLTDDNRDGDASLVESTVGDYEIDEDIYAAYVMATVDFEDVTVIGGVRYELTEFETRGAIGTVFESETLDEESAGFGTTDLDGDYDYFMPSLLVRWNYSDTIVMRSAVSQTIARPSFGALNPSSLAEIEESDGEIELTIEDLGNPDIDPYKAINLDFSFEYYPDGDIGVISAAIFYKDLNDYIAQANVADSIDLSPWTSLVGLTPADIDDADVLQFVNGEDAEVVGIELAWYTDLGAGFLLGLNATFTDTEATFDGRQVELPGSSEEIGNFILGYENYGIQARLAVNYKSESLVVVGGSPSEDVYQDEHTQVDASISFDLFDGVQIYFEGINLTDEPYFAYQDSDRYNWQYEEYGRTYLMGIRVTQF